MTLTTATRVSLLAAHNNRGNTTTWELRVEDAASGLPIYEAVLDAEAFAQLVGTSTSHVDVDGAVFTQNAARWGCRYEHATVTVPWLSRDDWPARWDGGNAPQLSPSALGRVRAWLAAETDYDDSWLIRNESYNGHRMATSKGYTLGLYRWVHPETGDPVGRVE